MAKLGGGLIMFKYVVQLIVGIFTFVAATFIAWYEGSTIAENTLEWGYSTPFTNLMNIEITKAQDISQLDYFVYAAKFQPLFPAVMLISLFYSLSVIGFSLIKNHSKWVIGFWSVSTGIMVLLSGFIINSTTNGGQVLFVISLVSGLLSLAVVVTLLRRKSKQKMTAETI